MDGLDLILKYAVVPVVGIIFAMYNTQKSHDTDIEVLKAQMTASTKAHDLEMKNLQILIQKVFDKLDKIEESLRK